MKLHKRICELTRERFYLMGKIASNIDEIGSDGYTPGMDVDIDGLIHRLDVVEANIELMTEELQRQNCKR